MKKIIYLPAFILLSFISCNQRDNEVPTSPGTPEALQEKSGSYDIGLSKSRYQEDLVESLYGELLEKSPELKALEKTIAGLNDQRSDSAVVFGKFDSKNTAYYNATQQHIDRITDSSLRLRVKTIIDNSLNNYDKNISRHKNLISMISSRDMTLGNLHIVLKLVKTLPMIEKYQAENMPSAKPLERVIRNYDKAIQQTDTLTKR